MKNFEILWELPKCDTEIQTDQMLLEKWCQQTWSILGCHKSTIFFKPWNVCKAQQSKMQENKACLYSSFGKLYAQESPENLLLLYFHSWVSQVWVQHQCSMSLNHRSVKALQSLSYQNRGKELALHLLPPHGTHNTYGNSCLWYSLPLPTLYEWNQESREWLLRHFQFCSDLILEFHIF